jgi:DNA-binding PadR family transcriptional regulator
MRYMHHEPCGESPHMAPPPEGRGGHPKHRHQGPHHGPQRGPGRRRPFDYGALRLVVLAMIAETPSHGYELMKGIEERMGGGYSPSPGVIYPTLAWLEDMGFAVSEAEGGRKRYRITGEGEAFLVANKAALEDLQARLGAPGRGRAVPEPVIEAMRGLKRALRARFAAGEADADAIDAIAAAIRTATGEVEKDMPAVDREAETVTSTARVVTPKAASYAAQLCTHFAHKMPSRFEGSGGEIAFPLGTCRLHVEGETLTMTVAGADAATVERLESVVASHLRRFAFREELVIDWQRD